MLEQYQNSQPIAYKIIKNTLSKKHFAHAYLIETNGYDKSFDFALTFAKLLLCPYEDCINCMQCQMIDDNNFPELKIINPDGNGIKKEQLTELQEEFNKKSIVGNKKVYIINKAEKLNINSANTILKFLEEPQEGIIAILVTNNIYQLLDTIISRCQIISLNGQVDLENKGTFNKIGQLLTDNNEDYNNFINDESNKEKLEALLKFIKYYENNHKKILLYMNDYWFNYFNDKQEMSKYILLTIYFYKDVLNYKIGCNVEIFDEYLDFILDISNKNTVDNLVNKINIINEYRTYLDYNANLNLLMDKIIIELESGVR